MSLFQRRDPKRAATAAERPDTAVTDLPLFAPTDFLARLDPHQVAGNPGPGTAVPAAPMVPGGVPIIPGAPPTAPGAPPLVPPPVPAPAGPAPRAGAGTPPPPTPQPIPVVTAQSLPRPALPAASDVAWLTGQVDWTVVAQLRTAASKRLSTRLGAQRLEPARQHDLGRRIIADLLEERASEAIAQGLSPWDATYQARVGQAVFDALFRLGRLQSLVDDDALENIIISGADNVWLEYADGRLERGEPVADSDQDLIDFLCFIAARSEVNERSFSPAEPRLHLRLDSGARLAAAAWVTPRPSVVIRRHRLQTITLDQLVERHTLSRTTARFLAEAVRRRASIVVSGAQGAGKTTLMRALCAVIPPDEVIGTFETEYELHLHQMADRHRIVFAWEARPGSGEQDGAGHRAGEFLLDDALYDSFRFNLSRQIVGEVRGREILAMIKAMQSGSGSLSTTHANSAEAAIRKLITCAMEAGPHVTAGYATRAIAEAIDFIVHMEMTTEKLPGGGFRRHRGVKEILSVAPSDSPRGYSTTRLFSTLPGEAMAALELMPEDYLDAFDPLEEMWRHSWP
jgi:Flp pilus assembly CpaF family ATPase